MPKQKNSATSAISPAVSAARGISIMVPNLYSNSTPFSAMTCRGDALQLGLDHVELVDVAGQRDHHLRLDYDALERLVGRSLEDGPHLHLDDLRHDDAQADAAQTHHGVALVHAVDAPQQFLVLSQTLGLRRSHAW